MTKEKIEKGAISEEALEEIVGGLKAFGYDIPNDKILKAVINAGVAIGAIGIGVGGKTLYDRHKANATNSNTPSYDDTQTITPDDNNNNPKQQV